MKTVIQRVSKASVSIDNKTIAEITEGYLLLLGVGKSDTEKEADLLIEKIINLRIMSDKENKMNKSILNTKGEILVVSQFTLHADCKKGRRPSFIQAANPEEGEALYNYFVDTLKEKSIAVQTGKFGAMMNVSLTNDGPVTIILDTNTL
ncbi:MAG: D-tyrosyl-tRNA(Tyr) deacylase [Candidatus Jacksonbacteria bacterium]|jgi:D-aminoacyl-tRNA deacylase|nr:D-tyrosyl-tRNA(Tyr) deacylase [Candidatus Jacksonbacteria bacterium]MBT6034222.1 D-tyrosyl-tRNA(Tyr) deacylase [Candidatus Jacksonbacteria bacterium]MBT6301623.1 D-tyrosyl-tRNA(Tyr) deacylase [Candidatus Jacksonbacteria bacterium]MBT6757232.1 D-tyrosyl-tRNA(Tyr) deacylase [Candidatus Jacksonbacteria bacterium]MBT6955594.1 D-tyrosyl-tRNA(Tyr) deacylase [Candidatus Jacksonbacteria bacterium]